MFESHVGPVSFGHEAENDLSVLAVAKVQEQVGAEVAAAMKIWAASVPEEKVREAIAQLEMVKEAIEEQITAYEEVLLALVGVKRIGSNGNGHKPAPSKRRAVLALLREAPGHELKLEVIRRELLARGVMPDTERAAHALQMTLQNMKGRGEVERVRPGYYRLAASNEVGEETDEGGPEE